MQRPATWDTVAEGYAERMDHFTAWADEALRIARLPADAHVLDVGCGPGTLALRAAPRVGRVTAVDFAPAMVDALRARAMRDALANVEAAVMDAQALSLEDETFDAAFCLFAFMFFPDRARAFGEIRRVLKPGGQAIVATWGPIERRPMMKIGFDALAEAMPDLPRPQKGDLQQPEECVAEMRSAGFRDVVAHTFTSNVHVDSPEHYRDFMLRTGAPFASLRERLGEPAWQALTERLDVALRERIPAQGADLAAEGILTLGTR